MSYQRSEYEDKNLKKNSFSERLLKLELNKMDSQRNQLSKQFKHEKDQLRRQLAEGEQIIKLKSLDPDDIRPLSSVDLKKLSPKFARRFSASTRLDTGSVLPQISTGETLKHTKVSQIVSDLRAQASGRRRFSLPPAITVHQCVEYECGKGGKKTDDERKLLQRRSSAHALKETENISGKINEFLGKLKHDDQDMKTKEMQT